MLNKRKKILQYVLNNGPQVNYALHAVQKCLNVRPENFSNLNNKRM